MKPLALILVVVAGLAFPAHAGFLDAISKAAEDTVKGVGDAVTASTSGGIVTSSRKQDVSVSSKQNAQITRLKSEVASDVGPKYGKAFSALGHNVLYMDIEDGVTKTWCQKWLKANGFDGREDGDFLAFDRDGSTVTLGFEGVEEKCLSTVWVKFPDAVEKSALVGKYKKLFGADFKYGEKRGEPEWDRNTASETIAGFDRRVDYRMENGKVEVEFTVFEQHGWCYYSRDTIAARRLLETPEANTKMFEWGNDIADCSLDVNGELKIKRGGEVAKMSKTMRDDLVKKLRAGLKEVQEVKSPNLVRSIKIRSMVVADMIAGLKKAQEQEALKAQERAKEKVRQKSLAF